MYLAEMCGIKVFATGGIGGVHRGGQDTMDVSADLTELGRTSMAVVASGCKSFLDIPRTLEFLETQGVTVATYSKEQITSVPFPAFYTTDSGVQSPLVVGSPEEAAAIICKFSSSCSIDKSSQNRCPRIIRLILHIWSATRKPHSGGVCFSQSGYRFSNRIRSSRSC